MASLKKIKKCTPQEYRQWQQAGTLDPDTIYITKVKHDIGYLHAISINETTSSGVWKCQFMIKNAVSTAYTQLSQIGHYLYENHRNSVLPATGLCIHNQVGYFITDITANTDNTVNVGMYKINDGTRNVISSDVITVTDTVM